MTPAARTFKGSFLFCPRGQIPRARRSQTHAPFPYCKSCGKSLHILTEYGHIPPELISSIQWDASISETQKNIIIELLSELVRIEGGSFTMGMSEFNGSPLKQPSLQTPHRVTLSTFYLSKFLVTQRQWFAFMPNHTCCNIGDELPVDSISWEDCIEFTNRLRKLSNIPFSLPTEAQWLFVAQERNQFYDKSFAGFDNLEQCAWTTDNSNGHSHRPGLKMPNGLGIMICAVIFQNIVWTDGVIGPKMQFLIRTVQSVLAAIWFVKVAAIIINFMMNLNPPIILCHAIAGLNLREWKIAVYV